MWFVEERRWVKETDCMLAFGGDELAVKGLECVLVGTRDSWRRSHKLKLVHIDQLMTALESSLHEKWLKSVFRIVGFNDGMISTWIRYDPVNFSSKCSRAGGALTLKISNTSSLSSDSSDKFAYIVSFRCASPSDALEHVKFVPTATPALSRTQLAASKDGVLSSTKPPVTPYLEFTPGPGFPHRCIFMLCEEPSPADSSYRARLNSKYPTPSRSQDLKERMVFYAQPLIEEENLKAVG
ncbi:hypothetical protein BJ878DRAFT_479929 [Calycina marina]|uniref:Uncharacterized protein n=1 Tax=Calycina marina TaxID=1763456 RepID=A0A9P8CGP6_9HELO|nr:hypothetical protein BJ878DRAFT_479929 [Calycina marina]